MTNIYENFETTPISDLPKDRDYNFYIDRAKKIHGFKSDAELNRSLSFKGSMISFLRTGKTHLSDEKMIALCDHARIDPEIGLIDLNVWRAPEHVKSTYATILQKLTHTTAAICILAASTLTYTAPAHAANLSSDNADCINYGK